MSCILRKERSSSKPDFSFKHSIFGNLIVGIPVGLMLIFLGLNIHEIIFRPFLALAGFLVLYKALIELVTPVAIYFLRTRFVFGRIRSFALGCNHVCNRWNC